MTFKRMMVLGAVASALAFTGCQNRSQSPADVGSEGSATEAQQPATGGSGYQDSTLPGSSNTIGGTKQDDRPGTELGGTGAGGTGDLGGVNNDSIGGSGNDLAIPPDNSAHGGTGGSGTVHQPGTGDSLEPSGVGNDLGTSGDLDQNNLDQRDLLDDEAGTRGSDNEAR